MRFGLQPAIQRLFGGETRAVVLGLLADATVPKTGYQLSKALRTSPSRIYAVLRDLAEAGIVQVASDRRGVRRYSLADAAFRRFLLRHVRITTSEEWFRPERVRRREAMLDHLPPLRLEIRQSQRRRKELPNYQEFERSPEKDRILRELARKRRSRTQS